MTPAQLEVKDMLALVRVDASAQNALLLGVVAPGRSPRFAGWRAGLEGWLAGSGSHLPAVSLGWVDGARRMDGPRTALPRYLAAVVDDPV